MAFSSLGQLVGGLERRPQWQSHQQFQAILEHWPKVVGPVVAAQTHPLTIQRHILEVSTSSPVWAQNLAFQRCQILDKMVAYIPDHGIKDIRFSPGKWTQVRGPRGKGRSHQSQHKTYQLERSEARALWSYHPSQLPQGTRSIAPSPDTPHPLSDTPTEVFHDWAAQIQARSRHLPQCPCCHSPTPTGEIERWGVCCLCATKQWQHQKR